MSPNIRDYTLVENETFRNPNIKGILNKSKNNISNIMDSETVSMMIK